MGEEPKVLPKAINILQKLLTFRIKCAILYIEKLSRFQLKYSRFLEHTNKST